MFGVLLDVSGSMESAYALDKSHQVEVERTHAIFTTVTNIAKREVACHQRQESIFVSAFGLKHTPTCDLPSLLDDLVELKNNRASLARHRRTCNLPVNSRASNIAALVELAKNNDAFHAERWIRHYISEFEARLLYPVLRSDAEKRREMISLIPSSLQMEGLRVYSDPVDAISRSTYSFLQDLSKTVTFGYYTPPNLAKRKDTAYEEEKAIESEAYKYAEKIITDQLFSATLHNNQKPVPRPIKDISEMFDNLLHIKQNPSSASQSEKSECLHKRIQELLEPIKPYIFGGTPMCNALNDAVVIYECSADPKVLFLLSDGHPSDGDPRPIASRLRDMGVIILTCFLTSHYIANPRRLFDSKESLHDSGKQALFDLSSTMKNVQKPLSYLIDANWELPPSGESRLFIQANSLDVVNEFCDIVVSQMEMRCDALVHLLGKVPLADYINKTNSDFEPKLQEGGTCYANAIAAVFHLAMHRIFGRDGGIQDFDTIRKSIIKEYGVKGASTEGVLKALCPRYRLHFREVDERDARQAINKRRPVIAIFRYCNEEWAKFKNFYKDTPKGILTRNKVKDTCTAKCKEGGHAVVLIKCDPECLTFMNSWGKEFADGGFFRVKDANVLNKAKFFDVYWTIKDLSQAEIKAYEESCIKITKDIAETCPSIKDLRYECLNCNMTSNVDEFLGHILEAECPKCHTKFKPTNKSILHSLYSRAFTE